VSDAVPIIYYIRDWFLEKHLMVDQINVFEDNMSTIHLVNNGNINFLRSRHIEIGRGYRMEKFKFDTAQQLIL
jgi:hypothetical protein